MKKLLSLIIVVMMSAFHAIADDPHTNKSSLIIIEILGANEPSSRPRAPMLISIEAWYNGESNSIDIYYDGEAEGEVYLSLDDNIVGYDSSINTSLQLPTFSGIYKIEIISESWIAEGYLQL